MGNQASSNKAIDSDVALGDNCRITQDQMASIRQIWKETLQKGPDHAGKTLYLRLFIKSQEIQKIFQERGEGDSGYDARMHKQQTAFTQALDKIVKNLDKPEVLNPYLVALGARHANLGTRGFEPYLWDNFKSAMIELGTEWESIASQKFDFTKMQDTKTAWKNIVDYVIEKMKNGYYEEIIKRTQK